MCHQITELRNFGTFLLNTKLDVNSKTKLDAYNEMGGASGTYLEKGEVHTGLWW
jgi:hypothetical protein